jgi:hypothetical protein
MSHWDIDGRDVGACVQRSDNMVDSSAQLEGEAVRRCVDLGTAAEESPTTACWAGTWNHYCQSDWHDMDR